MHQKRILLLFTIVTAVCLVFLGTSQAFAQAKQPPGIVILKGSPMGGVKFDHKTHSEVRAAKKCETCHHASKPEKPLSAPQEACFDCHVTPAKPPMKTNRQGAFHNPLAKAGTCIDCHVAENAKGKKAPTKCMECHKKDNV